MGATARAAAAIVLVAAASGCTSQAQMDSTAPQRILHFSDGYQSVYSRTYRGMRNCNSISPISTHGELYSDLGYGEITTLGQGLISSQPMMRAKLIRAGSGTRGEFTTLTLAHEGSMRWMEYWSLGGLACPVLHYSEQPPAPPG